MVVHKEQTRELVCTMYGLEKMSTDTPVPKEAPEEKLTIEEYVEKQKAIRAENKLKYDAELTNAYKSRTPIPVPEIDFEVKMANLPRSKGMLTRKQRRNLIAEAKTYGHEFDPTKFNRNEIIKQQKKQKNKIDTGGNYPEL